MLTFTEVSERLFAANEGLETALEMERQFAQVVTEARTALEIAREALILDNDEELDFESEHFTIRAARISRQLRPHAETLEAAQSNLRMKRVERKIAAIRVRGLRDQMRLTELSLVQGKR